MPEESYEEKNTYQECATEKIVSAVWDPDRCEEGVFCPICDTWMDDYEGQPDKCPNCGVKLDGWNYVRDFEKEKEK